MAVPGKLEGAFNPDRSADPLSWDWVDLTALTTSNNVTITRGRSSSSSGTADPSGASFPMRNGGGDTGVTLGSLTPRKADGDWYPGIGRGMVLRYSQHAGASWLALTGETASKASTADAASLDIVGNIAIAIQFRAPLRPAALGGAYEIAGKWGAAGQRSWRVLGGQTGTVNWQWSADGTNTTGEAVTSLAVPTPTAGSLTWAMEFDVDNGASGNTTTFYVLKGTITDLLADKAAYLFGDPDINSGTTSIFSSTAVVELGSLANSGFSPYPGGIERVFIRAGTLDSGTIAVDADFTAEAPGTTSFADDAATPKTWTIAAPAEITDRKARLLGEYGSNQGTYPGKAVDGTAQRTITAAGPLRRLRQGAKPLRSALYRRITNPTTDTTLYAYWPLEDGREATSIYTVGGVDGGIMAMGLAGDNTLPASEALPTIGGGQPYGWNLALPPLAPTDTWEYTGLYGIPVAPDAGASEYIDLQRIDCMGGATSQWVLRIDDTNVSVFAKDLDGTNVLSATFPADPGMFGTWMIVQLAIGLSGTDITWDVDIIPLDLGSVFGDDGTLASLGLHAGRPVGLRTLEDSAAQEGLSVGHFIITTGAVAGWLAPADTAYAGEPAPARVFRLCREEQVPVVVDGPHLQGTTTGWPASIAAGAVALGPQRPKPLLELLEEAAVADQGYVGEPFDLLGISYRSGATLRNQAAALSLTDEVGDLVPNDDDRDYVNRVTVARDQGSQIELTATGADDPDPAGSGIGVLYEAARTVNVMSDLHVADQASWWLHEATWPEERYDQLTVNLDTADEATLDTFDGFNVGDVIEATSVPADLVTTEVAQVVDGWTETISPFLVVMKPNGRPAGAWQVGVREDDALAKRDTDGSVLDADFDAGTDTSMDVDVTRGLAWTTDAGEFPFDVNVAGAQVTVSAIGAPAGTVQTFTVSATIANGINKTVDAGAEVRLWRPTIRSL